VAATADQRPKRRPIEEDASLTEHLRAHPLVSQLERRTLTARSRIARIPAPDFSRAIIDLMSTTSDGTATVEDVREGVMARCTNPELKRQLLALISEAGGQIEKLQTVVADWFDGRMEALSRAYKLHVKWALAVIGVFVAIGFNVDAIGAATDLYRDDALRAAVTQQATESGGQLRRGR
jgi:hypothetical protein